MIWLMIPRRKIKIKWMPSGCWREIVDLSGFRGFDKTDVRDARDVWASIKTLLDRVSPSQQPADETLLSVLIDICEKDLVLWWANDRTEKQASRPFVYYLFGGKDFCRHTAASLPKIYKSFLSSNSDLLGKIRILIAVVAQLTAYLDSEEESEKFVTQGSKVDLAKGLAGVLVKLKNETELYIELELLRPS